MFLIREIETLNNKTLLFLFLFVVLFLATSSVFSYNKIPAGTKDVYSDTGKYILNNSFSNNDELPLYFEEPENENEVDFNLILLSCVLLYVFSHLKLLQEDSLRLFNHYLNCHYQYSYLRNLCLRL